MSEHTSNGARLLASRLEKLLGSNVAAGAMHAKKRKNVTAAATTSPLPDYVGHALARWRLLHDVPFRYLVPDARLLPAESIRFFTIDGAWLDALATGALVMGGGGSRERARAHVTMSAAHAAADGHRHYVRDIARGRLTLDGIKDMLGERLAGVAAEPVVSGFLLRSKLVSDWPGLQLRAWTSNAPADVPPRADPATLAAAHPELVVPILRLERLSPSVMIALFAGIPRLIWIEEPHHGVQYGVEYMAGNATVPLRNETGQDLGTRIAVPMRTGADAIPGVVDVAALGRALDQARPLDSPRGSGALALTLIQAPARQRFSTIATSTPASPRRHR